MFSSGIYSIDAPNGDRYVGSTVDFDKRRSQHFAELEKGTHKNRYLQRGYSEHGGRLEFNRVLICSPEDLLLYEQRMLDAFAPVYNISTKADSVLGTKHADTDKYKTIWQDPVVRARRLSGIRRAMAKPDVKARQSAGLRKALADPVVKAKCIARLSTPEAKAQRSEASKKAHADSNNKRNHRLSIKKALADPDVKARQVAGAIRARARQKMLGTRKTVRPQR